MKKIFAAAAAALIAFAAGNANAQCIGCQQNAQPVFGATQAYSTPIQSYAPVQSYAAPMQQSYAAPIQQSYAAPIESYAAPIQQSYSELRCSNAVVRSSSELLSSVQLWRHTCLLSAYAKLPDGRPANLWWYYY